MLWKHLKHVAWRTSTQFNQLVRPLFQKNQLSEDDLTQLERLLIQTNMGASMAQELIESVRHEPDPSCRLQTMAHGIYTRLLPYEKKINWPAIMIMVGVNGSGKTTTIGKLAYRWAINDKPLRVVAADSFRAGATEQLAAWVPHASVTCGTQEPASLAYRGAIEAVEHNEDVIIDTAGRLPNNQNLMDELSKIYRVVAKARPNEDIHVLMVLDATVGQHALVQMECFQKAIPLSGIVLTKMDGTAKGGIALNCATTYKCPIYAVGYGESASDLHDFSAKEYALALMGIDQEPSFQP